MTDFVTIWKGAAAPAKLDKRSLTVHRGRVVSVADRVTSTTFSGKQGDHTTVNSVPEVWIADASGQELRFADVTLTHCRPGHEVVVISDPNGILGMGNFSSGHTWYSPKLTDQPRNGPFFLGLSFKIGLWLLFAVFVLGVLTRGRAPSSVLGIPLDLFFVCGIALAIWLPYRARLRRNQANKALRARIDREIKAAKP